MATAKMTSNKNNNKKKNEGIFYKILSNYREDDEEVKRR